MMSYANIQNAIKQNAAANKRLAGNPDSAIKSHLVNDISGFSLPLKDVANSFFEPRALRHILDAEIDIIKRNQNKQIKKQPRCYLLFGNKYGLDDLKKKKSELFDIEFPKSLIKFIAQSFNSPRNEEDDIKEAIDNEKNRIFIIHERSTHKITKSKNNAQKQQDKEEDKYEYKDIIISIAICQFHKTGCYLLWFATNKNNLSQSLKINKNTKDQFRFKGFGVLLLAVLQTCQKIIHDNDVIVCQANITAAVGFYLQNHFEIIKPEKKEVYNECKQTLEEMSAWYTCDELVLLKSRAKVNVLHTWMYEGIDNDDAFNEYIIPQLCEVYFPNITTLGHLKNVDKTTLNLIMHDIDPMANIDHSFNWYSLLEKDEQDEPNHILFASNNTLERLLDADNCQNQYLETIPDMLPSYLTHDYTDNLFNIMSQILYHNNEHENDIRCFLGFLYSCFAVLSDDHPFLKYKTTSKNPVSENLQSFNIAKELCTRLQDEYEIEELSKFLGLTKEKTFKEPAVLKMAFKLLKCHIIPYGCHTKVRQIIAAKEKEKTTHVTFRGYPMDIAIFSNIIYPSIYLMSAETNHCKDLTYEQRLWHGHLKLIRELQCIKYTNKLGNIDQDSNMVYLIGHSHNNQFQMFRLKPRQLNYIPNDVFIKQKYRAKYYNIKEEDVTNTIYRKTSEWLNESKCKHFQNREDMFTFQQFKDAKIKIQNYLPIVRIIDPLEVIVHRFKDTYCSLTSHLIMTEFLSFHATACLQNSGLDNFYRALKARENNNEKNVLIIGPEESKMFLKMKDENDKQLQLFDKELTNKQFLCIQLNIGGHYITCEVNYAEALKNLRWDVMVADSLGISNDRLKMNTIHLERFGVKKFLKLLKPSYDINVSPACNNTMQYNSYDCGVHGARRFYSYWNYGEVYPEDECNKQIMEITPFRLHMLEIMLEQSHDVSCYVSPTGKGITFPIPKKNHDKSLQGTPTVSGRLTRRGANIEKKIPILPLPDSSLIIDVDAEPDDDDEEAIKIASNYEVNSNVNLNFDTYLLHVNRGNNRAEEILESDNIAIIEEQSKIDADVEGKDSKESPSIKPPTPKELIFDITSKAESSQLSSGDESDSKNNHKKAYIRNLGEVEGNINKEEELNNDMSTEIESDYSSINTKQADEKDKK
jgi:hypothetical protein